MSNTHAFGSRLLHEVNVGYYDLQNTRISKYRDILNSTLGIYNPLEHAIGGLAALMPTIDINTQRNSGGIGNAWDFWDIQRVWTASDKWTLAGETHTLKAGLEYRRINLQGEYMARTNGDLDYNNWVFFFTGHGASGGGSDLDQGDTRRDFLTSDIGGFVQDDWRLGGGLTVNAGLRYDIYGNFTDRAGGLATTTCRRPPRSWACSLDSRCPPARRSSSPTSLRCRSAWSSIRDEDRPQPDSRGEVRIDNQGGLQQRRPARRLRVAADVCARSRRARRLGDLLRADRRELQAGSAGVGALLLLSERPVAREHVRSVPRLNVNPFAIPLGVQIARDGNGVARWVRADGSAFPATSPFSSKSNVFIDPLLRTPYQQQWTANLQYELRSGLIVDAGYVGARGVGLLGKVNLAVPVDPRVTPVNGFTDIYDKLGRLINPDFFVPAEFLGLSRSGGFQQLTNVGRSTYHSLQTKVRARLGRALTTNVAYTLSRSMDILSSDGGLIEHDPAAGEQLRAVGLRPHAPAHDELHARRPRCRLRWIVTH